MRYLGPLADPTFKKIFGEFSNLTINFLNATLKLEDPVVELEYLQNEILSEIDSLKTTIVDVRCTDSRKRHFIVEMQVSFSIIFYDRVFYNATKVFSRQLSRGKKYYELQPVYAINILDDISEHDTEEWMHHYKMMNINRKSRTINNSIHLIFIELPKLRKRSNFDFNDPLDLWLKFLIDPNFFLAMSKESLKHYPEILQAVDLLDESNYTPGQLEAYDRYLDAVRMHNMYAEDAINAIEKTKQAALDQKKAELHQKKAALDQKKAELHQKKAELEQKKAEKATLELNAKAEKAALDIKKAEKNMLDLKEKAEKHVLDLMEKAKKDILNLKEKAEKDALDTLQKAKLEGAKEGSIEVAKQISLEQEKKLIKKIISIQADLKAGIIPNEQIARNYNVGLDEILEIKENI